MPPIQLGSRETLKTITPADLRKRAAALLTRGSLLVAAVGDVSEAELARQIDRAFGGLPVGEATPALPNWTPPARGRSLMIERPVPQSTVLLAMPGLMRDDRRLVCLFRHEPHPGWRHAIAAVHRGARETRPGLQRIQFAARLSHGRAFPHLDGQRHRAHARGDPRHPFRACAPARRRRDRPRAGRGQDLPHRVAGFVARFLRFDRRPAAWHADRRLAPRSSRQARGTDRRSQDRGRR